MRILATAFVLIVTTFVAASAQPSKVVRDLANRDASQLEIGLLRLQIYLGRIESLIGMNIPENFFLVVPPPTIEQQSGILTIEAHLTISGDIEKVDGMCETLLEERRKVLGRTTQFKSTPSIQTAVGASFVPALVKNQSQHENHIQAAHDIENRTRLYTRISAMNMEIECEGWLIEEALE